MSVGWSLRFTVYTHHLLPPRMRHASQNACLGDGGVAFVFQHTAHGNSFVAKSFNEQTSGLVIPDDSNRKHVHSEISKIVYGIRAAARSDRPFTVLQNQDRSFAR